MVSVSAGFIGPQADGTTAQENLLDTRRVETFYAMGGRSGVLQGFAWSGVSGQMQLTFTAGEALVPERDGSNVEMRRGYLVWADVSKTVQFGAASASARNDAVVAAVVDVEDGAQGTGAIGVGGHLVVVPGVSGTTAVRTDAQIKTYLGRGGWVRLLDVPIASTDTQINTASVVPTAASIGSYDSGAITNAFTASTGWTLGTQSLRRLGRLFHFEIQATRTGAAITSTNGNIVDTAVATWSTTKYPILMSARCIGSSSGGAGVFGLMSSGTAFVAGVASDIWDISTSDTVVLFGYWAAG